MDRVSQEVAEAEFERYCEALHVYSDRDGVLNEEDAKALETHKSKFIEAVRDGRLVIEADGSAVFTASTGLVLRFGELTVEQMMVIDKHKKDAGMAKTVSLTASITGVKESEIKKLSAARDFSVCNALICGFF